MIGVDFINELRRQELEEMLPRLRKGAHILEIGAGSGQQARELEGAGYKVTAIDLPSSDYAAHRVFPVLYYDGATIPFPDDSFDVVYSSNVLEHVSDLPRLQAEIRRVVKPGGECLHIMPSHVWRFWTSAAAVPGVFVPYRHGLGVLMTIRRLASSALRRHGERGNVLSELWLFHPAWWRNHFRKAGFEILEDGPVGIFYTAEILLGFRFGFRARKRLARVLGSSSHFFRVRSDS